MAMASSSVMCRRNGGGDCSHGVCSMVAARQLQFQRVLELVKVDMERNISSNDPNTQITFRRRTQTSTMQMRNAAPHPASNNHSDAFSLQNQLVLNALSQQLGQVQAQLALQNQHIHGLLQRGNVQEQLLEHLASISAQVSSRNSIAICDGNELSPSNSAVALHTEAEIQCSRQPEILPSISNDVNASNGQAKSATIRWLAGDPSLRSDISNCSPHRQPISRHNASLAAITKRGNRCCSKRLPRKDKGNTRPKIYANGPKVLGENSLPMSKEDGFKVPQGLTAKDIAKLFLLQRNELEKTNPSQTDSNANKEHRSLNTEDLTKLLLQKTSELNKFEHELKARWFLPETQTEVVEPATPNAASIVEAEEFYSKYDDKTESYQQAEVVSGFGDGNSNFPDENTRLTDAILNDVLEDVSQEVASFCDEYIEHLYLCEFMSGSEAS